MSDEIPRMREMWLGVADTSTLFRCNTGTAWASSGGKPYRTADGAVVVPGGRPVALGLSFPDTKPVTGTHDLLGWTEVEITPSMVGQRIAVFTSIEAKNSSGGKRSDDQQRFMRNVQRAGGISGFASSVEQARQIISDWHKKFLNKPRP